jgi:putative transposase
MGRARIARVVAPGVPHHVVQRGNRRMDVFFSDDDRRAYLELLREFGAKHGVAYWGYCLMSNHVHLIAVPKTAESLALGIGWAHQAYTRRINFRENWRGYLWQGRFFSCPLDEAHAERALRHVELNPVRAKLVERAEQWAWSSARGHVRGKADGWTVPPPFLDDPAAWRGLLRRGMSDEETEAVRTCTRTGRPLGGARFVNRLERVLDRILKRRRPGPAPKVEPRAAKKRVRR